MAKKNNKKIKTANYSSGDEFGKLIKLIIIVTVIFVVFYGITFLVNKEKEKEEETSNSAKIQYDNILIGNILDQPNDEYYVMIYDENDYNTVVYETYLNLYKQKEDSIRYYTADLTNYLNSSFVSDKSNFDIEDIKDLKIKTSTLLKIKKGKIEKHYTGDSLKEHLQEISKQEEED